MIRSISNNVTQYFSPLLIENGTRNTHPLLTHKKKNTNIIDNKT